MKQIIMMIWGILLISISLVSAHEHDFTETKELIDSGIGCAQLTDEQLEVIGNYYMEQMHPGEAHEMMDQMMGGEGSDSLKQMHIQMARKLYCNEDVSGMMGSGMMGGGMMNMMGGNMMSSGSGGMMGSGIMGTDMMGSSLSSGSWWLWNIVGILFWIALLVALILLIIWLYKKIIGKTTNSGSALDILKRRFAEGEITKKEFESMKEELREK